MSFFFFNDTATTEIYTLSLHDALPISGGERIRERNQARCSAPRPRPCRRLQCDPGLTCHWRGRGPRGFARGPRTGWRRRSEEHTSELQSRQYLVCCLLLQKKIIMCIFC